MLGCTLVFTIPVAFHILREEDKEVFSFGLLIGFITIPFGSLVGGLLAGFPMGMLLRNSVPVLLLSLLLVICLKFFYYQTIRCCLFVGKLITALTYIGLIAAAFEYLTGITLIPGHGPHHGCHGHRIRLRYHITWNLPLPASAHHPFKTAPGAVGPTAVHR